MQAFLKSLKNDKLQRLLLALVSIVFVVTFIGALAPVKDNDALIYHLTDAKYFAQHHAVSFVPYTARSIWPYFMEMLFTLALLCKSAILAKLFHFSMACFCALAVYALGRRYSHKNSAVFALAIFFLTPGIFTQATHAYVDLAWTFFTFLGFYAFLLWDYFNERKWLILTAVFCGIAAQVKYLGLTTPLIIGIFIAVSAALKCKIKEAIADIFLFGITLLIVLLAYYPRIYLHTGNLLYPFYVKFIGENGWYMPSGFGMVKNFKNFITSPWYLTYYPDTIFAGGESQIGPIYLALLPGLLLIKKKVKITVKFFIFAGFFYFLWFFIFPAARFTQPLIPFLAILTGYVIWALNGDVFLKKIINGFFILFLLINLSLCFYYNREEITFFLKGANVKDYLAKEDRTGEIFQYINAHTEKSAKILLVNELRGFYLERPYILEIYYRIYDKYYLKSPSDIIVDLNSKGITHILYAKPKKMTPYGGSAVLTKIPDNLHNNLFEGMLQDKSFAKVYLEKITEVEYNVDPTQATHYVLYRLK